MENKLPDFLIKPRQLIEDTDLQPLDGDVYGIIYWCTKLKLEKCFLKNKQIADMLHSTEGSIKNAITRLIKKQYIKSIYERSKHQRELLPLIFFGGAGHQMMTSTSSNSDLAGHQEVTSNNNINGNDKNIYNTVNVNGNKNILKKLPRLEISKDHKKYLKEIMLDHFHDKHSEGFYSLVASVIPENFIFQFLSEVNGNGVREPKKLFTSKIQEYAIDFLDKNSTTDIGIKISEGKNALITQMSL